MRTFDDPQGNDPQGNDPLAALLRDEAAGPGPSEAVLDRVWSGVDTAVASGAPPPAVGSEPLLAASGSGVGKWLLAVVLIGGGATATVAATRPTAPDPISPAFNTVTTPKARPAPVTTPSPAAAPEAPAALAPVLEPRPEQPTPPTTPPARSARVKRPPTTPTTPAATAPGLPEELRLLERLSKALKRRSFAEARRLLDQHKREFPKGALIEEREAARVQVACLSGDRDKGTTLRSTFAKRWPASIHLPVMDTACAD